METSSYVDIFATKGVEYITVIGFLLAFIGFWWIMNRTRKPAAGTVDRGGMMAATGEWFGLATDRYYHQAHTWAKPEGRDVFTVGMDDFAQKLIGKASSLEIPGVGSRLEQGERGWRLTVDDKPVDLISPLGGEVVEVNREVISDPALINRDPYGTGWLMKVKAPKRRGNLRHLLSGSLAMSWMGDTEALLRGKIEGGLGPVLQDGGVPVSGIARELSRERWNDVIREFLLSD